VLIAAAPQLARIATRFTSYEYFWLYMLGLTCAAIVSEQSRLKAALSLGLGLLLSCVGLGTDYSVPRLTFGVDQLITGIDFIPAMIGLFGVSEVLRNVLFMPKELAATRPDSRARAEGGLLSRTLWQPTRAILQGVLPMAWRRKVHLLRSSAIGALIGMLPGAGADIAAWISYAMSKRFSRTPEQYGNGSLEGLGDGTGANNAALGGAWIPALVFGIPGDSVTAIAIGVLLMKNITPGPEIFDATKNFNQAVLVYSIYVTFLVANVILLLVGLLAIQTSSLLIHMPRRILLPIIVMFCVVGAFAMNASYFDVTVMLAMGLLGFVLELYRVPLGPIVLGIILGGQVEHKFIQCITKSSSVAPFFESSISVGLGVATLALWLAPLVLNMASRRRD
jgi:TctA family transporter